MSGNGNRRGCQASFLVSDMLAFRGSFSNDAGVKAPKTGVTSLSIDVSTQSSYLCLIIAFMITLFLVKFV